MSKTINSFYTKNNVVNYRPRSPALADDFSELAADQNLLWATLTHCWGGYNWRVGGTPFTTTSGTLVTTDEGGERDLDFVRMAGTASREDNNGDSEFGVFVFGYDIVVEATFTDLSTSTQLAQSTIVLGASWQWGSMFVTEPRANVSGNLIACELKARTNEGANGYLWGAYAGERKLTDVTKLPDGT